MDPVVGAALTSGTINLLGGVGSGLASIYNTDKSIKANKELAEYAYDKDLQMWNAANAYNHPTQIMKRYQDAGLNPNLIYGNTGTGVSTISTPTYKAPHLSYQYQFPQESFTNLLHDVGSVLNIYNNKRLVDAEVNLKNAQASSEDERKNLMKLQAVYDGFRNLMMEFKEHNKEVDWENQYRLTYKMWKLADQQYQSEIKRTNLLGYQGGMAQVAYDTNKARYDYLKRTKQLGYQWLDKTIDLGYDAAASVINNLMNFIGPKVPKAPKYLKTAQHTYKTATGSSTYYDYVDY